MSRQEHHWLLTHRKALTPLPTPTQASCMPGPAAPLIPYEFFTAWCPYCTRYLTEQLPVLLGQIGSSGQIQFVVVDVTGECS